MNRSRLAAAQPRPKVEGRFWRGVGFCLLLAAPFWGFALLVWWLLR